jgi:hypothetical protein
MVFPPLFPSELPLDGTQQENKGNDGQEIQYGNDIIIGDPLLLETAPYHYPDIGQEKGNQHYDIIDSRTVHFHGFFLTDRIIGKKQYQVNKSQEYSKVEQVAELNGYGGYFPLPVDTEGFEYNHSNDENKQECCDENQVQ